MSLIRFLALSLGLHLLLLTGFLSFSPLAPLGGGAEVQVELASSGMASADEGETARRGDAASVRPSLAGKGGMPGGFQGGGSGRSGSDPVLARILSTIELNKLYPYAARRAGLSGRVLVRFLIDEKGAPVEVELLRSSGVPILDEEAVATIRRGSYPRFGGPLPVWIRFELKERS